MTTLVLPIAGRSTRFNGKPKWLRTFGNEIMLSLSMHGIHQIDRVLVVMLEDHKRMFEYCATEIQRCIRMQGFDPDIVTIESSESQPETVYKGLICAEEMGYPVKDNFLVKDCDNYWKYSDPITGNCVFYAKLSKYPFVTAQNKSYITYDYLNIIDNIVEKKVISDSFNVGGYGFVSSKTYQRAYLQLMAVQNVSSGVKENHLSHLIFEDMIRFESKYIALECSEFIDWGTEKDWEDYVEWRGTS